MTQGMKVGRKAIDYTEYTWNRMAKMYLDGYSLETVANAFSVTKHTVKKSLTRQGLSARPITRHSIKPVPKEWHEMAKLRSEGVSAAELAKRYYCTKSTVIYRLREAKLREAVE